MPDANVVSAIVNDFLMEVFWHWLGGCANRVIRLRVRSSECQYARKRNL